MTPAFTSRAIHPVPQVSHDPAGKLLVTRREDPVTGRIVRVAVIAGGTNDRHTRSARRFAEKLRLAAEPDWRQIHDSAKPARLPFLELSHSLIEVIQCVIGLGRTSQE